MTVLAITLPVVALAVAILTLRRARRSPDRGSWGSVIVGVALLVATGTWTPQLLQDSSGPGQDARTLDLATAAAGVLACGGLFVTQVRLLQRRRLRALADLDAWLDAASTVLALTALSAAVVMTRLQDVGIPTATAWLVLARCASELTVTATAVANSALIGWRRDRRLWKVCAIFAALTAGDVALLLGASEVIPPGVASCVCAAGRASALALLVAASWRTVSTPNGGNVAAWTQLLAAADVVVILGVVMVMTHNGTVPSMTIVLAIGALTLVTIKVALLFRELLSLLDSRRLAHTDELTGLLNRRGIFAALERLSPLRTVHLLLLDLDAFKAVNDTHGHHLGDLLLQDTATRLLSLVPPDAGVGRLGGDEFVIVLTDLEPATVDQLVITIGRELGPRSINGVPVQVGVSIGASCTTDLHTVDPALRDIDTSRTESKTQAAGVGVSGPVPSPSTRRAPRRIDSDSLLRLADAAMYRAKRSDSRTRY